MAFRAELSIAGDERFPEGLAFKPDGTKLYVVGTDVDTVFQYSLSAPWDLSSAGAAEASFSVAGEDGNPTGVAIKDDGTKLYVLGLVNDKVFQYPLSTAWDVSSAGAVEAEFSVIGEDGLPNDIFFKPDGAKLYMVGAGNKKIFQYPLSTPWDVSSAGAVEADFSVNTDEINPTGVTFKDDGTKLYVVGTDADKIFQYPLSTPWDVSSAGAAEESFSTQPQTSDGRAVAFSSAGDEVYIVHFEEVVQYPVATPWDLATAGDVAVDLVNETDSGLNTAAKKTAVLALGISFDFGQVLEAVRAIGTAEADTALGVTGRNTAAVDLSAETDAVIALAFQGKVRVLDIAEETDRPPAGGRATGRTVTLAIVNAFDAGGTTDLAGPPFPVGLSGLGDLSMTVAGGERAVRLADGDYATRPTDNPANTPFLARGLRLHEFRARAFAGEEPDGRASRAAGEIEIANPDGRLDDLFDLGLGGRTVTIMTVRADEAFDQAVTRLTATVDRARFTDRRIALTLRDPRASFDRPVQTRFYKGTGGAEGGDSLSGRPVPIVFGEVQNIEGVNVDSTNDVWQFHDGPMDSFVEVRDNGVALTDAGLDVADYDALVALTTGGGGDIPEGSFATSLATGLLRLGAPPAARLTADVRGDAHDGVFALTHGAIARRILETRLPIPPSLDTASFDAVETEQSAPIGWWSGFDTVTVNEALARIMASAGGFLGFRRDGKAFASILKEPVEKTTETVSAPPMPVGLEALPGALAWEVVTGNVAIAGTVDRTRLSTRTAPEAIVVPPSWRRRVAWAALGVTQNRDNLGAITESQKTFFATPARFASFADERVRSVHRLARDVETAGLYRDEADALTEANRLGALHGSPRRIAAVAVADGVFDFILGDVWRVDLGGGFGPARDMTVIGVEESFARGEAIIEFFG